MSAVDRHSAMAVAYDSFRAKVNVQHPLRCSTTTTACFIGNEAGECKFCCRVLKKKEKKKQQQSGKCKCKDHLLGEPNSAVCSRFRLISDDCCKCVVALCDYIAEYVKCICSLICLQKPHTQFCCRLCNLIRASAAVWKNGCDLLKSIVDCLLGIE